MDIEAHKLNTWEGFLDWKKKPALKDRHGGMVSASFVLAVEVLENLAFLANASNLVLYLSRFMHFSPSIAATAVTNFMGTAFLLALLGGFLADAFFTTYSIYLIGALIEFMGLLILTIQAQMPSLKPPPCPTQNTCHEVDGSRKVMLFSGLYLVALGVGGIKGSLAPHGAHQFDEATPKGRKQRSAFFNYFVFCLSCGALIAVTLLVWLEDNKGWQWGFGVSTVTILISIPLFLLGSPFYRIKITTGSSITIVFKVLAAAICNSFQSRNPRTTHEVEKNKAENQTLRFLNMAILDNPCHPTLKCNTKEVEEVKIVIKILPIFMSTIILNSCLAQLSTFSVQQAATMDTRLGSLTVPPGSLPVFPVVFIMALAPIYNHAIVPLARKATRTEAGLTHLQRIGAGLALSFAAMAVAAIVEAKRRALAMAVEPQIGQPLPMTFLYVAVQYLFLGSADLFTLAGMMEFFFTEAPETMRSIATALSWTSLAMGYYFSSVLVTAVNALTASFSGDPWLSGENLNQYHLERFYWLMCALSGINFLHYLFWASRYSYRSLVSESNEVN